MRLLPSARLAVGLLLGLACCCTTARAQQPKAVTFQTKDQVELKGTFYPGKDLPARKEDGKDVPPRPAREAPCVLLLHTIGSDSQKGKWGDLIQKLQKPENGGCAVLLFDFRGHGDSTKVVPGGRPGVPGFWDEPRNLRGVKGFVPGKAPEKISYKDFNAAYASMLVNDIAAAKMFLDERNDAGDCNSARLIVIGAQDGAVLGALWMAAEWYRYSAIPNAFGQLQAEGQPEGKSTVCGIWLSINPSLGRASVPVLSWLNLVGRDHKVPMAFLYGETDTTSANFANHAVKDLKSANKLTNSLGVKGTKLAGDGLLTSEEAQDAIVRYIKAVLKDPEGTWSKRETKDKNYVWLIGTAVPTIAKLKDAKHLDPIPVERLGIR